MRRAASVAGLLMMVGALLALWRLGDLFSPAPWVIALQVLALALMVWARLTFGRRSFHAAANPTEGGLVTTGPYRFVRHPIYAAACLFGWAGVAAHPAIDSALLGALLLAGALVRLLCEERLVVERYPEYREYARRTKRLVPFVF
jgi:protein-S-isoprenylcysteine O-methyltransferase Ste14